MAVDRAVTVRSNIHHLAESYAAACQELLFS